jgi:hypothetical protein
MKTSTPPNISVAAYYYPCTHPHPRWDKAKYPGFTEWDLIRKARPRFPGHQQPNPPLWGYEDESDPMVMARKIDAAADHGLDAFIFDWYYYNDGPYLEGALDRGFLQAANNDRIHFAIMWANHDWYDIQGYNPADPCKLLYPGAVNKATWERITGSVDAPNRSALIADAAAITAPMPNRVKPAPPRKVWAAAASAGLGLRLPVTMSLSLSRLLPGPGRRFGGLADGFEQRLEGTDAAGPGKLLQSAAEGPVQAHVASFGQLVLDSLVGNADGDLVVAV